MKNKTILLFLATFFVGCNKTTVSPEIVDEPVTAVRYVPEMSETTLNEVVVTAPSLVHVEGPNYNFYTPSFNSMDGGAIGGSGGTSGTPTLDLPSQKIANVVSKFKCAGSPLASWSSSGNVIFQYGKLGNGKAGSTTSYTNNTTLVMISTDVSINSAYLDATVQHEIVHAYHQRDQRSLYFNDITRHSMISDYIAYNWSSTILGRYGDSTNSLIHLGHANDNKTMYFKMYGERIEDAIKRYGFRDPFYGGIPCMN